METTTESTRAGVSTTDFLHLIWSDADGFVTVSEGVPPTEAEVEDARNGAHVAPTFQAFTNYRWPRDRAKIEKRVAALTEAGHSVAYTPTVRETRMNRGVTTPLNAHLHVDLDPVDPRWITEELRPTVAVETSPGNFQGIWLMEGAAPEHPMAAGGLNHRLVSALTTESPLVNAPAGVTAQADPAGWDGTKSLRLPGTLHNKARYVAEDGSRPCARVLWADGPRHRWSDLDALLPQLAVASSSRTDLAEGWENVPPLPREEMAPWTTAKLDTLLAAEEGQRSGPRYGLVNSLLICGETPEVTAATVWHYAPNKAAGTIAGEVAKAAAELTGRALWLADLDPASWATKFDLDRVPAVQELRRVVKRHTEKATVAVNLQGHVTGLLRVLVPNLTAAEAWDIAGEALTKKEARMARRHTVAEVPATPAAGEVNRGHVPDSAPLAGLPITRLYRERPGKLWGELYGRMVIYSIREDPETGEMAFTLDHVVLEGTAELDREAYLITRAVSKDEERQQKEVVTQHLRITDLDGSVSDVDLIQRRKEKAKAADAPLGGDLAGCALVLSKNELAAFTRAARELAQKRGTYSASTVSGDTGFSRGSSAFWYHGTALTADGYEDTGAAAAGLAGLEKPSASGANDFIRQMLYAASIYSAGLVTAITGAAFQGPLRPFTGAIVLYGEGGEGKTAAARLLGSSLVDPEQANDGVPDEAGESTGAESAQADGSSDTDIAFRRLLTEHPNLPLLLDEVGAQGSRDAETQLSRVVHMLFDHTTRRKMRRDGDGHSLDTAERRVLATGIITTNRTIHAAEVPVWTRSLVLTPARAENRGEQLEPVTTEEAAQVRRAVFSAWIQRVVGMRQQAGRAYRAWVNAEARRTTSYWEALGMDGRQAYVLSQVEMGWAQAAAFLLNAGADRDLVEQLRAMVRSGLNEVCAEQARRYPPQENREPLEILRDRLWAQFSTGKGHLVGADGNAPVIPETSLLGWAGDRACGARLGWISEDGTSVLILRDEAERILTPDSVGATECAHEAAHRGWITARGYGALADKPREKVACRRRLGGVRFHVIPMSWDFLAPGGDEDEGGPRGGGGTPTPPPPRPLPDPPAQGALLSSDGVPLTAAAEAPADRNTPVSEQVTTEELGPDADLLAVGSFSPENPVTVAVDELTPFLSWQRHIIVTPDALALPSGKTLEYTAPSQGVAGLAWVLGELAFRSNTYTQVFLPAETLMAHGCEGVLEAQLDQFKHDLAANLQGSVATVRVGEGPAVSVKSEAGMWHRFILTPLLSVADDAEVRTGMPDLTDLEDTQAALAAWERIFAVTSKGHSHAVPFTGQVFTTARGLYRATTKIQDGGVGGGFVADESWTGDHILRSVGTNRLATALPKGKGRRVAQIDVNRHYASVARRLPLGLGDPHEVAPTELATGRYGWALLAERPDIPAGLPDLVPADGMDLLVPTGTLQYLDELGISYTVERAWSWEHQTEALRGFTDYMLARTDALAMPQNKEASGWWAQAAKTLTNRFYGSLGAAQETQPTWRRADWQAAIVAAGDVALARKVAPLIEQGATVHGYMIDGVFLSLPEGVEVPTGTRPGQLRVEKTLPVTPAMRKARSVYELVGYFNETEEAK